VIRNKEVLKLDLKIASLKQDKQNINLVREGEECGVILENFDDIQIGDILDCYDTNPKFDGITNTKSVVECYSSI
jgi:translation initiation factor IF-2